MNGFKFGFDLHVDEDKFPRPFVPVDFAQPQRASGAPGDGVEATRKISDEDVEAGRTWQPNVDFDCIISPHFPHQKSENGVSIEGAYRAIHHLSASNGEHPSVNERIDPALCSLTYQDIRQHRANIFRWSMRVFWNRDRASRIWPTLTNLCLSSRDSTGISPTAMDAVRSGWGHVSRLVCRRLAELSQLGD